MAKSALTIPQRAVVEDHGGTLLVSAAAGSGKTRVLVERLMERVLDPDAPANLDDFLIITFTKAAAAELREKIAADLQARLALTPENRHLQRQTTRLYLTQISTVHAFCAGLLRTYSAQLELPADFGILEEQEAKLLRTQAMEETLRLLYRQLDTDAALRAAVDCIGHGRDDRALRQSVLSCYEAAMCSPRPEAWMEQACRALHTGPGQKPEDTVWGRFFLFELQRTAAACEELLLEAAALCRRDPALEEKYRQPLEAGAASAARLKEAHTWDEACLLRAKLPPLAAVRKCEDPELRARIQEMKTRAGAELRKIQSVFYAGSEEVMRQLQMTELPVRGLMELVRRFARVYTQEKRRRRALDFSDLEHETLRLLLKPDGSRTPAAEEISGQFREILVDEFQDSNAIQELIYEAVSREGRNRFMVGDVKQSIYRFRMAQPEIFLSKFDAYPTAEQARPGEARKILLSQNFRSRPEILAAVNDVFSLIMSRESGELAYTADQALYPRPQPFPETPQKKVELHCIELDIETAEDEADAQKVQEEAEFVAGRVAELLSDGTQISDGDTLRPVRAGDIAILLRATKNTAETYARALQRRGIPTAADRRENLLESAEVQILISILETIDDPHRDIPLLSALASPVFSFSPQELAEIRQADDSADFIDAMRAVRQPERKLSDFLSWLARMRALARQLSVPELLEELLDTQGIGDIFSALADGQQRTARLTAFQDFAKSFRADERWSLFRFCTYLSELRAQEQAVPMSQPASDDAVRIMSVHSSKGLEFPVVFLADLSHQMNKAEREARVLFDQTLFAGADAVDLEQRSYSAALSKMAVARKNAVQATAEEMRILYVAMTRAKDMLIMSYCSAQLASTLKSLHAVLRVPLRPLDSRNVRRSGDWILLCALTRTESGALFRCTGPSPVSFVHEDAWDVRLHSAAALRTQRSERAEPSASLSRTQEPAAAEQALADADYRYPHARAGRLPSKLTATQLKGRLLDLEAAEQTVQSTRTLQWRRPSFSKPSALSAAERGVATHLFMQFARYEACTGEKSLRQELERLQERHFLTPLQASGVRLDEILTLFTSSFGRRILAAQNLRREFKFSLLTDASAYAAGVPDEKILLQGVVDCFWQEAEGLVIVDFKTDRVPGAPAQYAERYRPQLQAYAAALERIYQTPVREADLYFFSAAQPVRIL